MALSTQPYKGARDFFPEDKRLQKFMFGRLRETVERYGYEEYDAPILESIELYRAKSGQEIVNDQTYLFTDRGGREVVIRPEMTPTVSRMVAARRQELGYPLRWYSIPNLWRYERPQRGRLREHWQLNVDLFGVATAEAELEMIMIATAIFRSYGATDDMFTIQLNCRPLVNYILNDYLALDKEQSHAVAKLIDRMHKMPREEFVTQLELHFGDDHESKANVKSLLEILDCKNINELPQDIRVQDTTMELEHIMKRLQAAGVSNVCFDPTLMRGFDYYTGVVFEISDTHPDNNRSMMGGGRYDGLVGLFGVDPVPTVGFGLGDATLANFLELHNLLPILATETQLYIAPVGDVDTQLVQALAERLRGNGTNIAVDISDRKLGDMLKTATKKGVTACLVVGPEEIASGKYSWKNLETGESTGVVEVDLVKLLNDRH